MTAGSDWFDLPAPAEADLPRLYREVEALRLRNQLDPKRFYRKDEGEGKGMKGLPKYFAVSTSFNTQMAACYNLSTLFDRLAPLCLQAHPSVLPAPTISQDLTVNGRSLMNWWMMQKRRGMRRRNSRSYRV